MVYIAIEKLLHLNIVFIGQDFQDPTKTGLKILLHIIPDEMKL